MQNTYYLKNGICLVCEDMPFSKSVSVGIWVRAGSMYEKPYESGISHFIEHMLFKGTNSRTAEELAEEMDFIGGQINAYTARECTVYYTHTLESGFEKSLELLSDMFYNSRFSPEDIELERNVVLEEIDMYEDSPEDVALDTIAESVWSKSTLGNPVAGTEKSVKKITRNMMLDYMKRRYTPENTVISVAGKFDKRTLIALCEKYFGTVATGEKTEEQNVEFQSGVWVRKKEIEQTHLALAFPCPCLADDKSYEVSLLNNIFGGSMSSRLFQAVREKNGLCYTIYSYISSYQQAGLLGIYVALANQNLKLVQDIIEGEIEKICSQKAGEREIEKARSQMLCAVIMGNESVSARMNDNGKSQLLLGRLRTEEEIVEKINAISAEKVLETAQTIFKTGHSGRFVLESK